MASSEGAKQSRANTGSPRPDGPRDDKGHTILVLDDEEFIGVTWEGMKSKLNICKIHFFQSLEALQKSDIDFSQIDYAFTDKNFANSSYNGMDVAKYLKERKVAKVILSSGEGTDRLKKEPIAEHVDFILSPEKIPETLEGFTTK